MLQETVSTRDQRESMILGRKVINLAEKDSQKEKTDPKCKLLLEKERQRWSIFKMGFAFDSFGYFSF